MSLPPPLRYGLALAAVLALLLPAAAGGGEEGHRFTVQDIGTLGGTQLRGVALNNAGQVVGSSSTPSSGVSVHAFLWLPRPAFGLGAGIHDLGTLGGDRSEATGIDEAGRITGYSEVPDPTDLGHAFLWEQGVMNDLGSPQPGILGAFGQAINGHGEIAILYGGGFTCSPALWLPAPRLGLPAGYNDLTTPAGFNDAILHDLNDRGEAVGSTNVACDVATFEHAYLWLPAPAYGLPAGAHDLTAGAPTSSFHAAAEAINEGGLVVGWTSDRVVTEPFEWRDGVLTPLPLPPGFTTGMALDVDELDRAVGTTEGYLVDPDPVRALLWENGEVHDLNDLIPPDTGWVLERAEGINDRGQIVGFGRLNGVRRIFLLGPPASVLEIPALSPAGAAALGLALAAAGLLSLRRRRRAGGA